MEYIVNERGERTRVILDVDEYERLVEAAENAEDLRDHEASMNALKEGREERIPWERVRRS